jgi:hypothetical protein
MATSFAQRSEGVSAVSPLFGNKENPAAEQRQVDIERLLALPVATLAVQILPLWASGEISPIKLQQGEYAANEIASWLVGSKPNALFSPGSALKRPLDRAIAEAIQMLEHSGLLIRTFSSGNGSSLHLTRLGEQAIVNGDATTYLRGPADR